MHITLFVDIVVFTKDLLHLLNNESGRTK